MALRTKATRPFSPPTIITLAPDEDGTNHVHVEAATSRELSKSLAGIHFDDVNAAQIEIKKAAPKEQLIFRVLENAPART